MNYIWISIAFAAWSIAMYLLIARLSRKDESGRQLWRKLITPTPISAFSSSSTDNQKSVVPQKINELSSKEEGIDEMPFSAGIDKQLEHQSRRGTS